MNKIINFKFEIILVLISFLIFALLLGFENMNFQNLNWLYLGDLFQYQIGWDYFRNDIWRFPPGLNPTYGDEIGSSIVFTDSIPLLAFIFKILSPILPKTFQYFSLWIFLSIFLQSLISYLIILKLTKNNIFSLLSILFFVLSPVFIYRSGIHLSLMGQWIILISFYIDISNFKNKSFLRGSILVVSSLIHFYFTIILIMINFINYFFLYLKKEKVLITILKEIFISFATLILIMYLAGYFSIKVEDGLGGGYGFYNLNLNSFINPVVESYKGRIDWSILLPERNLYSYGEKEGFAYLGLGGIILLIFTLISLTNLKKFYFLNKKHFILFFIFFILISLSNNINFDNLNLISINLNKYIFGMLSAVRASGRLIWPVYYLIFIYGLVYIFTKYPKNEKFYFLIIILIIQLVDLSVGYNKYFFGKQYNNEINKLTKIDTKFWNNLSKNIKSTKAIVLKNDSNLYRDLKKIYFTHSFKNTNIVYLSRYNRQKVYEINYSLFNNFIYQRKNIFNDSAYLTKDENIVRHIYNIYDDKLKYYFRNGIWVITNKFIIDYNNFEKSKNFLKIFNKNPNLTISKIVENKIHPGLGWEMIDGQLNSSGLTSVILFELENKNCNQEIGIEFSYANYFDQIQSKFEIYVNNKKIILNDNKAKFNLKCDISKNYNEMTFVFENPKSLRELKLGLNHAKRSMILKNININIL